MSIRILVVGPDPFGPTAQVAGALMPWDVVRTFAPEPTGLWEVCWRDALAQGRIETVPHDGPFVDCADVADYLAANMAWSDGESVIGAGAEVSGSVERCVVWPGATVHGAERLRDAIRTDTGATVLVRHPRRVRAPRR